MLGHATTRLARWAQLLVFVLDAVAIQALLAYPTWWMGPALAFYSGLVN